MFGGPNTTKSDGALGAKEASEDNILGLVAGGVATGNCALNTAKKLIQPSDADDLLIDAAYDANNAVLVRYHIDEFFRLNPNGVLWLLLIAQGTTMAAMCGSALTAPVNKLIIDSGKTVKTVGVVLNPATGYTPTLTNGLDVDVTNAVTAAQVVATAWIAQNVYIDTIVIEGRQVNGAFGSLKNLRTMASPNVEVAILQDADVAALDVLYAKHAAVGSVLGGWGVRDIHEDLGAVIIKNQPNKNNPYASIVDEANGRWLRPAISSGALVSSLTPTEIGVLKTNGYIWADNYPEFSGVYFSGGAACTLASSDYAYTVNMRVWNKGARLATKKFTPYFNGTVETDDNGKISPIAASEIQEQVNNQRDGLGKLVTDGNATKTKIYIDPNQSIYSGSTLKYKMSIKPFGYIRTIEGTLGFSIN